MEGEHMNVGRYLRGEDRHVGTARTTQPQPPQRTEQEPVAWVSEDVCEGQYIDGRPRKIWWECEKGVGTAFYTTPPQRTWVGLTDKDWNRSKHNYDFQKGVDWAELILKEKNT
jgi:hypothetical protein